MKALSGIRILDLTHMLSGPYATMLLADLGAETLKIEPPHTGEATRKLLAQDPTYSVDGMGAYFLTLGRNKKSITLDIKQPEGLSLFQRLVQESDIVVSNFRAGVARRLGITYDALKQYNPKIICCSITGFGETGPNKGHASFDVVAQATGGGMSITGHGDEPMRSGIPIGDLNGGMMATIGILAALQSRQNTGLGQDIDISMQDCQLSLLNYMATMTLMSGVQPAAMGNSHFVHVPYDCFQTADGYIIIAVIADNLWPACLKALGIEGLDTEENKTQPGRWRNRSLIMETIGSLLTCDSNQVWLTRLREQGVPCAPVHDINAALHDPHIHERNMIVDVPLHNGQTLKQVGNPIKLSHTNSDSYSAPPQLGIHTDKVLQEILNLSVTEIETFRSRGVV
jgi:CoA:oxalate CoA-transferase